MTHVHCDFCNRIIGDKPENVHDVAIVLDSCGDVAKICDDCYIVIGTGTQRAAEDKARWLMRSVRIHVLNAARKNPFAY